jgi:hypothetical protein
MGVLLTIITGVLSYLSLLIFYAANESWSAPLTLTPAQEKVLSFQPQVANLEAALLKQRVDLAANEERVKLGYPQIAEMHALLHRMDSARKTEAGALRATNIAIQSILADKKINISNTERRINEIQEMLESIDQEVKAKLITSDQAQARRIALQATLNAATDAKSLALQLEEQSRQASTGASTLSGGSSSLIALQSRRCPARS